MPEINFKGKEYVFNHHLSVPYRPLEVDADKSIGEPDLNGNLIIQGDNLHALKALLPQYAGQVDCIFIDPPYNTGNENWSYNDNVNSPIIQEWLDTNPVDKEDMLRHDKWLAMMWPRIRLLHELLSETGSFWMTLDDNEVHRARMMMDEIFGEDNFVSSVAWEKTYTPKSNGSVISTDHDHLLIYQKTEAFTEYGWNYLDRNEEQQSRFTNSDDDPLGPWRTYPLDVRSENTEKRESSRYEVVLPSGRAVFPANGRHWALPEKEFLKQRKNGEIYFGKEGDAMPSKKVYFNPDEDKGVIARSWWTYKEVKGNQDAKKELLRINPSFRDFITPKPYQLVQRILDIATNENSLILDSFAGSATTAHAVLKANHKDNGNRKFILVECEDYADRITAERVRRVIKGYEFKGTQKEELLRQKLTWSSFQKNEKLLNQIQAIENLDKNNFDIIKKTVKNGELIVTGEKNIIDKTEGLGGTFCYCTLGEPLDMKAMLSGESLPDYKALASWIFHTSTGKTLDVTQIEEENYYLGKTDTEKVWMIYKPDLDFLKSPYSALTIEYATQIKQNYPNDVHLVLAPSKFISNKHLQDCGIRYAPLPFSLYRMESS